MANTSGADQAFQRLKSLVEAKGILRADSPRLTESDTRAKLIDPVFRSVLGWTEPEIRRETRSASGYADYVFGMDAAYLLVEAKRTRPRFRLNVIGKPRELKLSGPHLLSNKKMKLPLEQVQRYASDQGAQVAVLTNGEQFVIFRPYLSGRSWTEGIALAFHDHDDIVQNFAYFHSLLSQRGVIAGGLLDEFERSEGITETLHTPISRVHNPDQELVRNRHWAKMSAVIGPLLTDQAEDLVSQTETIRNCYVSTGLSDQADESLNKLLKDVPSKELQDAGVSDTSSAKSSHFTRRFERDIEGSRPGTYILTGGVGSGKTTFLRRFALVVDPGFIRRYCVWAHVDFLTLGNVEASRLDPEIRRFAYQEIRHQIDRDHPEKVPKDGAQVRELFRPALDRAERTTLYGIPEGSVERARIEGELVDRLESTDEEYVSALLRKLAYNGLRTVLVLDNTDQLGEDFQEKVFLFAQNLSQTHKALCIVSLREERFFAAFRRGIFDAFGDRRFHIGSPDLARVLKARLTYGVKKLRTSDADLKPDELAQLETLLTALIRSVTRRGASIVRMLACVSNGDMRHALDMFRQFASSGNTDIDKIIRIVSRSGGYTVPFHEFAKSALLGSRKYFRAGTSHVVNVFKKSAARRASHLTPLRILARLDRASAASSSHGEGFVKTVMLLREYRESFGQPEDFESVAGEMIRRGLIESEPPKVDGVAESVALRISASGAYYWRYLVRAFAYVDLVWIDTPVADRDLADRLAGMADSTDLVVRFERVRAFLDYISTQEASELVEVSRRSGAYRDSLMGGVMKEIEKEIKLISRKTGAQDVYGPG